jgi:outer membrane receptor protein involved in Fe transport
VTISGGLRGELWTSDRRDDATDPSLKRFLVPRASVAWRVSDLLSLRGAFQSGYRSPTINELYRPFRVGNVVTVANAELSPERANGFEGSALLTKGRAAARFTTFWTRLSDAITNVTLSSGTTITRQRQNAGRIRAAGVELEADVRVGAGIAVTAAGAFINSTFTDATALTGRRVPQVPRWQSSVAVREVWRRASASIEWRYIGVQFDDDLNEFRLDSSSTVDGRVAWRARRGIEVFAAAENLLNAEQDVGRTPIRTIGLPRTARAGVRLGFR